MGQPIAEPKGTLTLWVKALRPQNAVGGAYTATNQPWVQDRVVVAEIICTYPEAEKIAAIHRNLNSEQNAVATWEGSVTL